MANCVDPDQTVRSAASDLDLHCLHTPVRSKTKGKYDSLAVLCKSINPSLPMILQ